MIMANSKDKHYRQLILVPEQVTPTIFRLPCVFSVHKESNGSICYLLYDWDEDGNYMELRPGQWLCEDCDGKWEVNDTIKTNDNDTLRKNPRRRAADKSLPG